jgi:hypothetical protein
MPPEPLEALAATGLLRPEPPQPGEVEGLLRSGAARLTDAQNEANALESRFDLAYNAAHAFSLAALRLHGYRTDKRYVVFQCLPHTLGLSAEVWRLLDRCHSVRNAAEYRGEMRIDSKLLAGLLYAASVVQTRANELAERERAGS